MEKLSKAFFLENLPDEIDHTIGGECSGCGECCIDHLCISRKEIKEIERFIKKKRIRPINQITGEVLRMPPICPFRDNNAGICMIYEVRPLVCRQSLCSNTKEYTAEMLYKRQ